MMRPSYSNIRIIDPYKGAREALNSIGGLMTDADRIRAGKEEAALKQRAMRQAQDNTDRNYKLQKAAAIRQQKEYNYKVNQRNAIPGLVQGDIEQSSGAKAYTDDFNTMFEAKTAPAQVAWDTAMKGVTMPAPLPANATKEQITAYGTAYKKATAKADAAYTTVADANGYGANFVNDKLDLKAIEHGMSNTLREEYAIRKKNALAANNMTALAAIEADLGARVKAQDASVVSGKEQADAIALAEFKARSAAARKTMGGNGKGTGGSTGTYSSALFKQPGAELYADISGDTWFANNDEAKAMMSAAAALGMDDKQIKGMYTVSNTGVRDGFNTKANIPASVKAVSELLLQGESLDDIAAIKGNPYGLAKVKGKSGTAFNTALLNQDKVNAKYRKELTKNSGIFQAPSRDVAGLHAELATDFAGIKAPVAATKISGKDTGTSTSKETPVTSTKDTIEGADTHTPYTSTRATAMRKAARKRNSEVRKVESSLRYADGDISKLSPSQIKALRKNISGITDANVLQGIISSDTADYTDPNAGNLALYATKRLEALAVPAQAASPATAAVAVGTADANKYIRGLSDSDVSQLSDVELVKLLNTKGLSIDNMRKLGQRLNR